MVRGNYDIRGNSMARTSGGVSLFSLFHLFPIQLMVRLGTSMT